MAATNQTVPPNDVPLAPGAAPPHSFYSVPNQIETIKVATAGAFAGLIVPAAGALLATYVVAPLLCRDQTATAFCAVPQAVGYNIAVVLAGIILVVLLARLAVYRALLLVLAVTIAMWGLRKYAVGLADANLVEFTAFSIALYTLGFVLFYWVLRIRNFAISLAATIALLLAIGWALAS